ncbi:MAG: TolC family protein [Phenylobacterium sp.]|uniref:TolC family protein n=1 Tax=Phenylobacterium sp. TaxID=1871053 RepID=UPI00273656C6|nr:TolC family protein [Phenylobacterium sp.]MDP3115912.1 TolC family protein [Phenylobacterium sp.]
MPIFRPSCAFARLLAAPVLAALSLAFGPGAALAQAPAPSLTLTDAVTRALGADPSAAAADARVEAARAATRQAGLRPNPSVGLELENFAGSGAYSILDRTEATVSYQQTFERGGKRGARTAVAAAEIELVHRRQEVRRLDLIKEVQVAYAEALAAEADVLIAEARLIAAHRSQADIARRVRSARDPLFAGARAETLTAQAEIARDQARDTARNARAALAAFWGGGPDFNLDLETFFFRTAPATNAAPAETADLALLAATRDAALARVDLERARQVADPTLRAGVRYFGQGSDVALVVGGTIPLQRYDTNKAGVERALAERNAAEADIAAARVLQAREVARLRAKLAASAAESERIRAEVIPSAIKTVELVREGFNRGGFQYIDVTEAERALADARARRVAVLRQHHTDQAALDRLTGRFAHLASTPSAEPR